MSDDRWKGPGERFGKAPCMGCAERKVGCHSECPKYRAWKEKAAEISEALYRARTMDSYTRGRKIRMWMNQWKASKRR